MDEFASVVSADPELSEGFDAIGYSQGNIIIRAYIQVRGTCCCCSG